MARAFYAVNRLNNYENIFDFNWRDDDVCFPVPLENAVHGSTHDSSPDCSRKRVLRCFQWMKGRETGLFGCSHDIREARMTSALTPAQTHSLTRSRKGGTTLSHPMGEGQEGESFAAPLKIHTTGLAGRSSAKPEAIESYFLSWGERTKGEGGRKHSFH